MAEDYSVEELIKKLRSRKPEVREYPAEKLGKTDDPRAVDPLIYALGDAEYYVRENVWESLAKLAEHITGEQLQRIIKGLKSRRWQRRHGCAYVLGELERKEAVGPLIAALEDKNENVRRDAAGSLGMVGDASAIEPLIGKLKDSSEYVGSMAARALGWIGDLRTFIPLLEMYASRKEDECDAEESAFGNLVKKILKSEDYDMLANAERAIYSKLGENPLLLGHLKRIMKRRNELAAKEAEKLQKPRFQKRKKPKRFWRMRRTVCLG